MNLLQRAYLYLLTVPVFLVVDLVWLGVVARRFYQQHLGYLMREQVQWPAAFVFYLLFVAGLLVFAVLPALEYKSLLKAVALGAFFGLITYSTYDLTNYATIRDWPLLVVVIDILWGMALSAIVASASYGLARWLL